MARLVEHCLNELRNVAEADARSPYGVNAKGALVVDFDNMESGQAPYMAEAPAPQPGDPLHYDSFIQKLCDEYAARFSATS